MYVRSFAVRIFRYFCLYVYNRWQYLFAWTSQLFIALWSKFQVIWKYFLKPCKPTLICSSYSLNAAIKGLNLLKDPFPNEYNLILFNQYLFIIWIYYFAKCSVLNFNSVGRNPHLSTLHCIYLPIIYKISDIRKIWSYILKNI